CPSRLPFTYIERVPEGGGSYSPGKGFQGFPWEPVTRSDAITCPKDSGITLFSGEAPAHPHIRAQGVAGWRGALAQPREPGPGASSWPPAGEPVDSGTRTEPGLLDRKSVV